ncbi:MAG: DUF904 domain-containing protein [Pseudomonadota bacterium]|nr:DUF904 domain-containing protein [Pseudomonadota bacterium]
MDDLIDLCAEMKRENQALKADKSNLQHERQQLMEKNQLAKTKLRSVLDRLKSMGDS